MLTPPLRSEGGYRQYPPDTVEAVRFIKRSQRLGFTLAEITDLLELHHDPVPCSEIKQRATAKIEDVDRRIAELADVRKALSALMQRCDTECDDSCTVLVVTTDQLKQRM